MKTKFEKVIIFALVATMCGCHMGSKDANEKNLIAVNDSDECIPLNGVDPTREIPFPEFETLEEAEVMFAQSGLNFCFCDFIANHPATMSYGFGILQESDNMPVTIADAPDGSIRIYGWDDHLGGTCTSWSAIYQVKDKGKIYAYEGLPDWEYDQYLIKAIYQLPHPKRHLYLFAGYYREWSSMGYDGFIAYERVGHELKKVNILRNEGGELVNEIGFEYNIPDFYFRFAQALTWDYHYSWDAKEGVLYFPIPDEDEYTLATDRFVRYRWNMKSLEPTDTVCNPRLYEPLRNYVTCYQHTKAGYFQVRVDSLADGQLRYTAWDREQDISEKPNIVLYGKRIGDEFHFYNPPTYTYVVTQGDSPEIRIYYNDATGQLGELSGVYKDE